MTSQHHHNSLSRRTARDICQAVRLRQGGEQLLTADLSPRDFVSSLIEAHKYADAIRVVAHTLPRRAAVWWNLMCLWYTFRPSPPAVVEDTLNAAVQWVLLPTAHNQLPLRQLARSAREHKAAQCLAWAVCYAGDTLLPELTTLPAKPHLTHQLVSASILVAAPRVGSKLYQTNQRQFLEFGIQIAQRKNLWLLASELQQNHFRSHQVDQSNNRSPVAVA